MNRILCAVALCGSAILFTAAPAAADDGFFNAVGKSIGLGAITQPLDDLNREAVRRSGPDSVYGQINESFWKDGYRAAPVPAPSNGYPMANGGYPPPPPSYGYPPEPPRPYEDQAGLYPPPPPLPRVYPAPRYYSPAPVMVQMPAPRVVYYYR